MNQADLNLLDALQRWTRSVDDAGEQASSSLELVAVAERALSHDAESRVRTSTWHSVLDSTRKSRFLRALPHRASRYRWADMAVRAARVSHYTLEVVMAQRAHAHPDRPLFRDPATGQSGTWSYAQVLRRARMIAAWILQLDLPAPRVAILADNSVVSATCDLACLLHDILVVPLGPHLDASELAHVVTTLSIDLVLTDGAERHARLAEVRTATSRAFRIVRTDTAKAGSFPADLSLPQALAELDPSTVGATLDARQRFDLDAPATVLFTPSGLGTLKGVVFSQANLVAKRFARGAALPDVGEDDVLLCYLPLYNTFGRFLEMLGCLYWGATYVFAGNPSADSLFARLRDVRPTGLISVPVRWSQLRALCEKRGVTQESTSRAAEIYAELTGGRLRWGLSAAGRLDPATFRFFQRMGTELYSGFGMTEATGGITMTPPGEYQDESLGIPLPAIEVSLDDQGQMLIRGPYVASALGEPRPTAPPTWFATGDLFLIDGNGHFTIVDKVKDIYKNSRGQTVAPLPIEQRIAAVPGVRRVFVAGDGREDNVALVVPDDDSPVAHALASREDRLEYFAAAIAEANRDLAVFERVVDFRLVDRDFSVELGELALDGSLRRKVLAEHFYDLLRELYAARSLEFTCGQLRLSVPRWVLRDLGVLMSDLRADADALINTRSGQSLAVARAGASGRVQVGDLEYELDGDRVDLGAFVRQPMLWVGNRALFRFASCKDGWDAKAPGVRGPTAVGGSALLLPAQAGPPEGSVPAAGRSIVASLHHQACVALLCQSPDCTAAVDRLASLLASRDPRIAALARRRLALAGSNPCQAARTAAFTHLLLDPGTPDDSEELLSFLSSGLPKLDDEAMGRLADADPSSPSLITLRRRNEAFRRAREPLSAHARACLLAHLDAWRRLAVTRPRCVDAVRGTLARWAELSKDTQAAAHAAALVTSLEDDSAQTATASGQRDVTSAAVAHRPSREQRLAAWSESGFLARTMVALGFPIVAASAGESPPIEIVQSVESPPFLVDLVRLSGPDGSRPEVRVVSADPSALEPLRKAFRSWIAMGADPAHRPAVPAVGAFDPSLCAAALLHPSLPTARDRASRLASDGPRVPLEHREDSLATLWIRSMAAFLRASMAVDFRWVPAPVSPSNVAVGWQDDDDRAIVVDPTHPLPLETRVHLVHTLIDGFYGPQPDGIPEATRQRQESWLVDALVEAFGEHEAPSWFDELRSIGQSIPDAHATWADAVDRHRARVSLEGYVPVAVRCAIRRFDAWRSGVPGSTRHDAQETSERLATAYGLHRFALAARLHYERATRFRDADESVRRAMDRLIVAVAAGDARLAHQTVELSDLQALLDDHEDRLALRRLLLDDPS